MYKCVDRNSLVAMLAAKRLAGVTPQVNLRNSLHASKGIDPGFEIQYRTQVTRNPKEGISGLTKRIEVLQKIKKKKDFWN